MGPSNGHIMCAVCFGPVSDDKLLLCSRCKSLWYCSRECQLQHFPDHKAFCKQQRRRERQAEELSLSDPKGVTMQKELTKYYDSVTNETIVCLRSPLRLGRPDALNSTMILELCWWYDPLKEKLKERFTFSKGILLSRAELDAKYPSSTEEPLMPTEEELAERRHETGDFSSASVIISAVDRKTRTHCHIFVLRTSLGHDTYSDLADSIVDVPLNDRWEDTLAILVHPRAPRTPSWWAAYLDWTVAHGWEKARKLLVEKQGDAEYWAPTLGKVVQVLGW